MTELAQAGVTELCVCTAACHGHQPEGHTPAFGTGFSWSLCAALFLPFQSSSPKASNWFSSGKYGSVKYVLLLFLFRNPTGTWDQVVRNNQAKANTNYEKAFKNTFQLVSIAHPSLTLLCYWVFTLVQKYWRAHRPLPKFPGHWSFFLYYFLF